MTKEPEMPVSVYSINTAHEFGSATATHYSQKCAILASASSLQLTAIIIHS
jgi:hypothetical protein